MNANRIMRPTHTYSFRELGEYSSIFKRIAPALGAQNMTRIIRNWNATEKAAEIIEQYPAIALEFRLRHNEYYPPATKDPDNESYKIIWDGNWICTIKQELDFVTMGSGTSPPVCWPRQNLIFFAPEELYPYKAEELKLNAYPYPLLPFDYSTIFREMTHELRNQMPNRMLSQGSSVYGASDIFDNYLLFYDLTRTEEIERPRMLEIGSGLGPATFMSCPFASFSLGLERHLHFKGPFLRIRKHLMDLSYPVQNTFFMEGDITSPPEDLKLEDFRMAVVFGPIDKNIIGITGKLLFTLSSLPKDALICQYQHRWPIDFMTPGYEKIENPGDSDFTLMRKTS